MGEKLEPSHLIQGNGVNKTEFIAAKCKDQRSLQRGYDIYPRLTTAHECGLLVLHYDWP